MCPVLCKTKILEIPTNRIQLLHFSFQIYWKTGWDIFFDIAIWWRKVQSTLNLLVFYHKIFSFKFKQNFGNSKFFRSLTFWKEFEKRVASFLWHCNPVKKKFNQLLIVTFGGNWFFYQNFKLISKFKVKFIKILEILPTGFIWNWIYFIGQALTYFGRNLRNSIRKY
jgi:hypothetical protein